MNRLIHSFAILLGVLFPLAGSAQQARSISLDEAIRLAESQSDAINIAEAGVLRARGQQMQARSQRLPQVGASLMYSRTLASQFSALADAAPPAPPPGTPPVPPDDGTKYYTPCSRYLAASGATDAERLAGLEKAARCASGSGGFPIDFSKVGFGSKNQYQLGISGSLMLFSGGRVQAQNRAANAARASADIELASQRARLALDVTEAYFDAALADRLVAIAESSLAQTESVLGQTRLARQVGNQSEFDLLRAQVTRDNQVPAVLQRRTDRDLAYVRLRQMLNLPSGTSLELTTELGDGSAPALTSLAAAGTQTGTDTMVTDRAPVRQLAEALRAQQEQLRVARSEWIPSISLSTQYGRLAFPNSGFPDLGSFLTNWTVSLTATVPIFTGGRIRGGAMIAEAGVREAQARYEQVRDAASLDAQQAAAMLAQAQAALQASQGTSEQAAKAYNIAEVRYREGLSTQVELNDARLLQQQASANRALAVRNMQVARMRVALLRDLPLGVGSITIPLSGAGTGGGGPRPQQMVPSPNVQVQSATQMQTSAAAGMGVPPGR